MTGQYCTFSAKIFLNIFLHKTSGQTVLRTKCLGAQRSPLCLCPSVQIWGWSAVDVERINSLYYLYTDCWSPSTLTADPPSGSTVLISSMLIVAPLYVSSLTVDLPARDPCGPGADPHRLLILSSLTVNLPPGSAWTKGWSCGLLILSTSTVDLPPRICMDPGLIQMDCWSSLYWLLIHHPGSTQIWGRSAVRCALGVMHYG